MKKQSKLEEISSRYEAAAKMAASDLSDWPRASLPGAQMLQREAQDSLPKIRQEYAAALKDGMILVVLRGATVNQEEFARYAQEGAGMIVARADGAYRRLADMIWPALGDRRQFGASQLGLLVEGLAVLGRDLDVRAIKSPQISEVTVVAGREELVEYVRDIVVAADGDRIARRLLEQEIVEEALKIRYNQPVVPVLLLGCQSEAPEIFGAQVYEIHLGVDAPTADSVLADLAKVRDEVKSKK
jgi:hypothetical protein